MWILWEGYCRRVGVDLRFYSPIENENLFISLWSTTLIISLYNKLCKVLCVYN